MGQVVFDIYAYDDPNGSALCRVTTSEAIEMRFRLPEIGFTMADGLVRIHSAHALATAANFHRHNLAKLTWIADDLDETELPFAFFLEEGDFMALSTAEEGGRVLTFTGPNTVQYLDRAILRETPFTTESIPYPDRRGGVNVDGMWTWGADADGREPGPIMVRAMEEGRDQPGAPLGDATWDFDRTNDSDSNPWDATGDEWQVPWGTTILELLQILMREGGLYWRSGRDLDFHAYNTDPGVDRSSATFTAGKVRFAAGFNIENEVRRAIQGPVERSAMLATGADYATSFVDGGSSDVPWVGHLDASSVAGASRLEIAAQRNLDVRSEIADAAFPLTHIAGENESTGLYVPGIHYVPGDTVRIHTGTNAHDFNEFDINVASAGLFHDEAGNWFGIAELGARTLSAASKAFEDVAGRLNVPHGLELCPIATYITAGDPARLYFDAGGGSPVAQAAEWDGAPGLDDNGRLRADPSGDAPGNQSNDAVNLAAGDYFDSQFEMTLSGGALLAALQGGGIMRMQWRVKSRSGVGISESSQNDYLTVGVRIFRSGVLFATLLVPGVAIGAVKASAYALTNRSVEAVLPANGSITTGDKLVVETGWHHVGPTSGGAGFSLNHTGNSATDLPEDDSTASAFNPWIQFGGGGTTELVSPGVNSELAGDSIYAARCDHRHHVTRDAEPTVDDDEDAGYPEGTYWVVVDDLDAPTEVLSVWLSLDGSTGAAVWAASGGAGGASALDDLTDVDTSTTPPTDGQALVWDAGASEWIPGDVAAGGGGSGALASQKIVISAGSYSTTSATLVDVDATNLTISITTGANRCLVGLVATGSNSSTTGRVDVAVEIDGAVPTGAGLRVSQHSEASNFMDLSFTYLTDILTAGTHDFVLQYARGSAGTGTLNADSTDPLEFWVMEVGGGGPMPFDEEFYTGADIAITSTTVGAALGTLGTLSIAASAGDTLMIGIAGDIGDTDALAVRMDVATIVSSAAVNFVSSRSGTAVTVGERGWLTPSGANPPIGAVVPYVVQSGDISGGNVELGVRAWLSGAGSRPVAQPFHFWVTRLVAGGGGMGAWTTYTPTLSATVTPPTLGSTTITGRYKQLDAKTYIVQAYIQITTGGAWNAGSGEWKVSLPAGLTSAARMQNGSLLVTDSGTRYYAGGCYIQPSVTVFYPLPVADASGVFSVSHNIPVTWATGDTVTLEATIEVA